MNLYFLAFIDILGFTELVLEDSTNALPGSVNLSKFCNSLQSLPAGDSKTGIIQFSDSIVLSRAFSTDLQEFSSFLEFARATQKALLSEGIICRGGVAHGRHYQESTIIYSQALIEAYYLESKRANGPRIIVSKNLLELIDPACNSNLGLLVDEDGEIFVDYVSEDNVDVACALISDRMAGISRMPERAGQKWLWFQRYVLHKFPQCGLPHPPGITRRT